MEERPSILILGIGNLLWADEGFGVRVVEALNRAYTFPANVTLMDGGTQGIYLIEHVRRADVLVVFDAVDYGLAPGTLKLVEDGEVPKFLGAKKVSLHQTSFQEVLAMADMLGDLPRHLFLIGVQPVEFEDYGGSLRDAVKAQIAPAIEQALAYLTRFGVVPELRVTPLPDSSTLSSPEFALALYEGGRPSEAEACRFADPRVLARASERADAGAASFAKPAAEDR
ncbi:hydrogenase expression/formation protein [Hyphomicrobium denitrificans 1NES1]|uniref:Hydrogenase expression/formation protein HupD n=1 Tax=Hyphomicrobium denitrificans 1NES1 TaxID=670307 RepID=N0B1H5_9HYPH|nr:HyaD/HybD family hydrogenase maturation endopeptidase [Hyphomicrobium denitrificans]AGK57339.1 hydrogenase expression/formation protein [Hyphomicrobium denitrificans 1NES1]